MEAPVISRSTKADVADLQKVTLAMLEFWQLPVTIGSRWLGLMLEAAASVPPHSHVAHDQPPHEQLAIPPEIEVEGEQCLFA